MSEKKNEVLELIRLIDHNKSILFKKLDLFRGEWAFPFVMLIVLLSLIEIFLFLGVASATEKIAIVLTFLALAIAYFSFIGRFGEVHIVNLNFKRLEKCVEKDKKPLLKALIKMKAKHLEFDLEQIYNLNPSMFSQEKLLEILYE